MQYEAYAVEMKGVTGVGTALEPGNGFVIPCKYVYYLAFSLIPPLQAEYYV